MFLLDNDTTSLLFRGRNNILNKRVLAVPATDIWLPVIVVEEQHRGRLGVIAKLNPNLPRDSALIPIAYHDLATHAFFWQRSQQVRSKRVSPVRDLGTLPGCLSSVAWAINDRSRIAGFSATGAYPNTMEAHKRVRFWQSGKVRALDALPGGQDSQAFGLNNSDWIVGWSEINHPLHSAQGDHHAVLWRGGIAYDLNALIPTDSGWVLEEASAVNNKGQIVGYGTFHGASHAFLLTLARHRI